MKKNIYHIISFATWIAVFLFWAIPFRSALNFHEELQLFLIDDVYFIEHISQSGGLSVWISEALVQFYNNFWVGAAIITTELILTQLLSREILCRIFQRESEKGKKDTLLFVISFIPMVILWIMLGDYNVMHSLIVAVIIGLLITLLYIKVCKTATTRVLGFLLGLLLFWWTSGTNHHRLPLYHFSFSSVYDRQSYDMIDYDYLVRANRWQDIINKADKEIPYIPPTLAAANLALGMNNKLTQKAYQSSRFGTESLIPSYNRELLPTLFLAEIYFQLGLVNSAQRMYFEAMETIPNYNKSIRCVRRLAETNLINGQYEVAKKYLMMLEKTVYYRKWAQKTLSLIAQGESAINGHPLYGHLRKVRLEEDFLFSDREIDRVFGHLFVHCPDNYLALQYFLLYPVLENDMDKYKAYLQVVKQYNPNALPKNK